VQTKEERNKKNLERYHLNKDKGDNRAKASARALKSYYKRKDTPEFKEKVRLYEEKNKERLRILRKEIALKWYYDHKTPKIPENLNILREN